MRLFWRILGGYFLAWALLSLAIFGALLLDQKARWLPRAAVSQSPPVAGMVQNIATNLRYGGEELFRRLAQTWPRGEPPFVVDETGHELLGREVAPETLAVARSLAVESDEPAPVKWTTDPEGRRLLVFFPEGRGPVDLWLLRWLLEWPWLAGVVLAVAGLLLAGGLTASWTRPIEALKRASDTLAEGNLEPRFDPALTARRDEIGDLGRHFEAMAQRLAQSVRAQRRLLHDVSHELRSPLARLGVAVELARRRPDRIQEALDRIEREGQRLDRLIGEVLTLARLEDSGDELEDYFDLLELLRVIRDDVAFEADAVGVDVELRIPDLAELVVRGNAELLHRAVENVVRNALKHAEGSRRIDLTLDELDDRVRICVRDHGLGTDAESLESFFEPFSRGRGSSGFGLGLAIARRAVEVHGGSIDARSHPGGGVEVRIDLPRRSGSPWP